VHEVRPPGFAEELIKIPQPFAARNDDSLDFAARPGVYERLDIANGFCPSVAFGILDGRPACNERISEQRASAFTSKNHDALTREMLQLRQTEKRLAIEALRGHDDGGDALPLQLSCSAPANRDHLERKGHLTSCAHRTQSPARSIGADEDRHIE
jgi:hypothetical protein